jgi:ABC-2 type transport system permease protein
MISLSEAESEPDERQFNRQGLAVAVLLEGTFPSAFRNRFIPKLNGNSLPVKNESTGTKMIVISDGDIIRNEVQTSGNTQTPSLQLGLDKYTGEMYGNRDFIINCLNYLVDNNGIMDLRSRELKLRLLDRTRIRNERLKWQLINVMGPVVIVLISGILYTYFRKRKYARP